jgi:hypothetical protein
MSYSDDIPQNYSDIEGRGDRMEWRRAIKEMLGALLEIKTWEIVDLPEERKPLDCMWVFAIKTER